MKKLLLFIPVLFFSCVNPSMERGFESITQALIQVTEDLNFYAESITSDLAQIEEDIYLITKHIERINDEVLRIDEIIQELRLSIQNITESLKDAATKEQMQQLQIQVFDLRDDVQLLWNLYDFDADGVINGVDKCPETPYGLPVTNRGCPLTDVDGDGVLNADDLCDETWGVEVDETGCEIVETGTTTNTI